MKVLNRYSALPAMDGDGVNINRIADFDKLRFDPYLMMDEIKSDNEQDFIGGFPPHPHRGIETFTYIRTGGFEHRDQMGNVKHIRAGDVQWMSTGSGVVHSEMPLADAKKGLHGFQIWLNMPAKHKMRPPIYQDTSKQANPCIDNEHGAKLVALAGNWGFNHDPHEISSSIQGLAGHGAIADLTLAGYGHGTLNLAEYQMVCAYVYQGELNYVDAQGLRETARAGQFLVLDPHDVSHFQTESTGAGLLLLAGKPINEEIVYMGPFVMNSQAEIEQAVHDYQQGRFEQTF
ncbi:pirin family protein [Shewanella sp. Actino-trap-3]|uniref:pirin family protein n=1 Tax=Shewanella sp. Actino-trap-3 TaxID=2058331 RepID=UPI000C33CDED|nr:pirin family protein [Shewanella sp. Actino-trap-3]PKG80513.1 pirin family protein [Shewanella sp. Actino-trap-3]